MKKWFFLAVGLTVLSISARSQSVLDQQITIVFDHVPLEEALFRLIDQTGAPLLFSNDLLPQKDIYVTFRNTPLREVLDFLLEGTNLSYRVSNGRVVLIKSPPTPVVRRFSLSGFVEDETTGEKLIGAGVAVGDGQTGTASNDYGYFSLSLPAGPVRLQVSFVGYKAMDVNLVISRDTQLLLSLQPDLTLEEVIVTDLDSSFFSRNDNAIFLNAQRINALPRLGGESDLLRAMHLLPGVQTGADGIGGLFVRGGNAGHNLILIDGVPVYNYQHGAGLLSIFNTESIKSARFIRGGFPARYGGRLSSVLDIRTRDGNDRNLAGSAEIGLLSARALLEGPIVREKSSFLISARTSLVNWYLRPLARRSKENLGETGSSDYRFYDLNGKINVELSPKDELFFSFYAGEDQFGNNGDKIDSFFIRQNDQTFAFRLRQQYQEALSWANYANALRWSHILHPRVFLHSTLTLSRLNVRAAYTDRDSLQLYSPGNVLNYDWNVGEYASSIQDLGWRTDLEWTTLRGDTHYAGLAANHNVFRPGVLEFGEEDEAGIDNDALEVQELKGLLLTAFWETERRLGDSWSIDYGAHLNGWLADGRSFWAFQPRLSVNWRMSPKWSWRVSVNKMAQFLHLLSGSDIGLPTDLWVPATRKAPQSIAWQGSLGLDWRNGQRWQLSLEGYYKYMDHLVSYSEGATFLNDWEKNITTGRGWAYGFDLLFHKRQDRWEAWLSYSLAWAQRQFPLVNLGERFPFKYDHRHDIKFALTYAISPKLEASTTWIFGSGLAYSLPVDAFTVTFPGIPIDPVTVINFGDKNRYRLPSYHRWDIGLSYRLPSPEGWRHSLYAGLTNIYDRQNPVYIKLRDIVEVRDNRLRQIKDFVGVRLLPFLPSINYSFKF